MHLRYTQIQPYIAPTSIGVIYAEHMNLYTKFSTEAKINSCYKTVFLQLV